MFFTRRAFIGLSTILFFAQKARASDFDAFPLKLYFEDNHVFFTPLFDYIVKNDIFLNVGIKLQQVKTLEESDCAVVSFSALLQQLSLAHVFVMNLVERPGLDIIGRKSRGLTADLTKFEDKIIAYTAGDIRFARFKQLLALKNISSAKLHFEAVGAHILEPLLAAGEVDAILGEAQHHITGLKARGVPADDLFALNFQDQGLELYGLGLAVKKNVIIDYGDKLTLFLDAFVSFLKNLQQDLSPLIAAERAKNAQLETSLLQEEFGLYLQNNIFTPNVLANGFGIYTRERFEKSLAQLDLKGKYEFDSVINAAYLPKLSP